MIVRVPSSSGVGLRLSGGTAPVEAIRMRPSKSPPARPKKHRKGTTPPRRGPPRSHPEATVGHPVAPADPRADREAPGGEGADPVGAMPRVIRGAEPAAMGGLE